MGVLGHAHFTAASIVAVVQAVIGLAVAFGVPLSVEERRAIIDVVTALSAALPLGGAVLAHGALSGGSSTGQTGGEG